MRNWLLLQVVAWMAFVGAVVWFGTHVAGAAANGYVLTLSTEGGGAIQADPALPGYAAGQAVALTAVPEPGWKFVEWQGDFNTPANWWDTRWRFRLPLSVDVGDFARSEQPVTVALNFTQLLNAVAAEGEFTPMTLRLVEVSAQGDLLAADVPFQFDAAEDYDPTSNAAGTLVFLLTGSTPANAVRHFHVYFETATSGIPPLIISPQVTVDEIEDEDQVSFRVSTANASYYFQKQGAALSSLVDGSGRDWIDYRPEGGSAGNYRGIPNVQPDYFHPGATSGTSTLVASGPLRAVVRAATDNGWEMEWHFYPRFATATVLSLDEPYWFLYEGTPGGKLDVNSDFIMRSSGVQTLAGQAWTGDLAAPEWLYFADPQLGRSLFLAHPEDDDRTDSYWAMNEEMTVFGYGRNNLERFLDSLPNTFILGLMESTAFTPSAAIINGIYQPVSVSLQPPEDKDTMTVETENPLQLTVRDDMVITARFEQEQYTLEVTVVGEGRVDAVPQQDTYTYGQMVELSATPAEGWVLEGWSGAASGFELEVDVAIVDDTAVTATFIPEPNVGLIVDVVGGGAVTRSLEGALRYGDVVALTAAARPGWQFSGWSGDLGGGDNPSVLRIDGLKTVTATFTQIKYTLYLPLVD